MRTLVRSWQLIGMPLLVSLAAAVAAAIGLAILDIYLTGHGEPSLRRPWIDWGTVVALSRADVLMLAVAAAAGLLVFALQRQPAA